MTAVDMCALHPAELLTITGSSGIMRHKRKEELARATGGYQFPVR